MIQSVNLSDCNFDNPATVRDQMRVILHHIDHQLQSRHDLAFKLVKKITQTPPILDAGCEGMVLVTPKKDGIMSGNSLWISKKVAKAFEVYGWSIVPRLLPTGWRAHTVVEGEYRGKIFYANANNPAQKTQWEFPYLIEH